MKTLMKHLPLYLEFFQAIHSNDSFFGYPEKEFNPNYVKAKKCPICKDIHDNHNRFCSSRCHNKAKYLKKVRKQKRKKRKYKH